MIKTAKQVLSEHGINIMELNDDFNTQLLHAMEEYKVQSQPPQAGLGEVCRWVLSNDRRPEKDGIYYGEDTAGNKHRFTFLDKHWRSDTGHPVKLWLEETTPKLKAIELPSAMPQDFYDQVKEHIKTHRLFDWGEALTEEEMTYLEDLLLTFNPKLPHISRQIASDAWDAAIERFCYENGSEFVEGKPLKKFDYLSNL